jgi:hypothetical protein
VSEITSTSTVGNARITLQFDLSRDIDGAARDMQARMAAIESRMWPSVGLAAPIDMSDEADHRRPQRMARQGMSVSAGNDRTATRVCASPLA